MQSDHTAVGVVHRLTILMSDMWLLTTENGSKIGVGIKCRLV